MAPAPAPAPKNKGKATAAPSLAPAPASDTQAVQAAATEAALAYLKGYPEPNPHKSSDSPLHFSEMAYIDPNPPYTPLVLRPNHGLASAVRKAAYVQPVVAAYAAAHVAGLGSFAFDAAQLLAMQVAMLFSVVGRASEVSYSDDVHAYNKYKEASVAAFEAYMQTHGNGVPKGVVRATATALQEMHYGKPTAVKRVLEVSHNLDLLRCCGGADMAQKIRAIADDVGDAAAASLAALAEGAILRTGDRLLYSHSGTGTRSVYDRNAFYTCSRSAKDAWAAATADSAPPTTSLTLTPPCAGEAELGGVPSRFLTSFYKVMHQAQMAQWRATNWTVQDNVARQRQQVLDCLETLLSEYCKGKAGFNAMKAYGDLISICKKDGESTIDMAVRLWTTGQISGLGSRELCSVLNEVLRGDDMHTPEDQRPSPMFKAAVTLICAIQHHLTANRRTGADQPMHWPRGPSGAGDDKSDEAHTAFRGAGIPIEKVDFHNPRLTPHGTHTAPWFPP